MIIRTPLLQTSNSNIFLKPENLQPFGSYKIRGVLEAVRRANTNILRHGLSAASAGNMAQAVAFAARENGVPCEIYVPDSAPEIKKQAILKLGARLNERSFAEIWNMVRRPPPTDGLFLHPVFTPGLKEGYATIADELLADHPALDAVIIPFGVGGLTIGVARRLKQLKPHINIFACEPETAAPLAASLAAGRPLKVERVPSFVDAIGTPEVLPEVFEHVQPLVTSSLKIPIAEISAAVRELALSSKLICEGAAATALAAAHRLSAERPELNIACVLTGGNIASAALHTHLCGDSVL